MTTILNIIMALVFLYFSVFYGYVAFTEYKDRCWWTFVINVVFTVLSTGSMFYYICMAVNA